MNKQPPPRLYLSGCFRLTEECAGPAQKFRVLSVEAVERRDAESPRCNSSEKEQMQVWLRYIKYLSDKYEKFARKERAETDKAELEYQKVYHIHEEMKCWAAADALENLLNALETCTAKGLMQRMGEKDGEED